MSKLTLLLAGGAGYVLGARAGRSHYDKISERSEQLWQDPRVQRYLDQAKGLAGQKARDAAEVTKNKLASDPTSDDVPSDPVAVPGDTGNDTVGTSGTGPQGTLP